MKQLLAKEIASRVDDRQIIGLGSGTTAELAITEIGRRAAAENLTVFGVPTSTKIALIAAEHGIRVLSPLTAPLCDWGFDGADEVDPQLRLIKGRGAAMLLEKIIAVRSKKLIVLVTEDKLVDRLGVKFPVPIEVVPAALQHVFAALRELGAAEAVLRESKTKYGPEITESGNFVVDARFNEIPTGFEQTLNGIVGVVENGLFETQAAEVLVAKAAGVTSLLRKK